MTSKLERENTEQEFYIDAERSQKVESCFRAWKSAEDQYINLVQFVKNTGVDPDSLIPTGHQHFPFRGPNYN
jgi:hypothetical protein